MISKKQTERKLLFRETKKSLRKRKKGDLSQIFAAVVVLFLLNLSFSYFLIKEIVEFNTIMGVVWVSFSIFFALPIFLYYRKYKLKKPLEIYESFIRIPGKSIEIPMDNIKEIFGSRAIIGDNISLIIKTNSSNVHIIGPLTRKDTKKVIKILKKQGVQAEIRSYTERLKKKHPFHSKS